MDLERYKELKQKVAELQQEANRAEGQLKGVMERLEREHGCASIKQTDVKVNKIQEKLTTLEANFDKALKKFEEKWGDKLDDES